MIRTSVLVVLSTILFHLCGAQVQSQIGTYSVTDLGDEYYSWGMGINESTQIATSGHQASSLRAFLWQGGTTTDLGDLGGGESYARDINDWGQVVGNSSTKEGDATDHAFVWNNGVMQDLGTLGGESSQARSINNNGQIVGSSQTSNSNVSHAFLWQDGSMQDLGTWSAYDINDRGQVVGSSQNSAGDTSAFLWENGVMNDLGILDGARNSRARAINEAGTVVGTSAVNWWAVATMWDSGNIIMLGEENSSAAITAMDINNQGQVVGEIEPLNALGSSSAFIWTESTGMVRLSQFVDESGAGWSFHRASAINDSGQIVGSGRNPQGEYRGFLLTPNPVPEPSTVLVMGLGFAGFGLIARRRQA